MDAQVKALIDGYRDNGWLIRRHAEGLTDAGCLKQPGFEAISFNWVLGHIVGHRDCALAALEVEAVWSEGVDTIYARDPGILTTVDQGRTLGQLLSDLAAAERRLREALAQASEERLGEVIDTPFGEQTRFSRVSGLQWHETYHVGQLGLLRSLALSEVQHPSSDAGSPLLQLPRGIAY